MNRHLDGSALLCFRLISREEFMGECAVNAEEAKRYGDQEKTDLAFKAFDKNQDGFITKNEMLRTSKNLTKQQASLLRCNFLRFFSRL